MTTFPLAARSCTPTNGKATGAVIQPMPRSAMVYTNGRGMTMVMAAAKSIAIPARGRAPRSGPTCVPSEVSTNSTCISMSRRMKPWSMPNGSHRPCSNGCVSVISQRTLTTHEPLDYN
jgi:hypothetical protein